MEQSKVPSNPTCLENYSQKFFEAFTPYFHPMVYFPERSFHGLNHAVLASFSLLLWLSFSLFPSCFSFGVEAAVIFVIDIIF